MKEKKKTKKQMILEILLRAPNPVACHEFRKFGVPINDHSANTRINELIRAGMNIKSKRRKNSDYKEYWLPGEVARPNLSKEEECLSD